YAGMVGVINGAHSSQSHQSVDSIFVVQSPAHQMIWVIQRQNRPVVRTQAFSRGESLLTSRTVFRGHRMRTVWDVRPLFNRKENGKWGMGNGESDLPKFTVKEDGAGDMTYAIFHMKFGISPLPIPHSPFPTPHKSLRSGHNAFLEDQRAAQIGPHLAGRRASDLLRLAPTHLHLLLGHSNVNLPLLDRRPYVRPPFVFQPGVFVHKVVFKPAHMSDLFLDIRPAQIQIDEALFAIR